MILESEAWCPACKLYYGKIFRKEVKDGFYTHVTEPDVIPKYCQVCNEVVVRK